MPRITKGQMRWFAEVKTNRQLSLNHFATISGALNQIRCEEGNFTPRRARSPCCGRARSFTPMMLAVSVVFPLLIIFLLACTFTGERYCTVREGSGGTISSTGSSAIRIGLLRPLENGWTVSPRVGWVSVAV